MEEYYKTNAEKSFEFEKNNYVDLGTKALLLSILPFARFQDIDLICNNMIYIL